MADSAQKSDYKVTALLDLHKSDDATLLIQSHQAVAEYHEPYMAERERCHDFVNGDPWTDEEKEVAEQKKKALIEFNKLKTSERTFIGAMIQQRYDVKPAPREPTDQNKADLYTALYHWTADVTDTRYKDPGLVRDAWAGGNAWQETYVVVTPGRKPRLVVENQNPFAIYPDPNRRDLVNNHDCEFIDRVPWLSRAQLCDAYPEHEAEITDALPDPTSITYEKGKKYADRVHEWQNYRNGKYKVIERFYKVRKKLYYTLGDDGRQDIGYDLEAKDRAAFKEDFPNRALHVEREEYLFLAVAVPAMGGKYLYNGPYQYQPRDPATGRIMFTLVELVDEDLDGQPSGHVKHQMGPIRLINSMMTNQLFAAKNAAGQSHTVDADAFDDTELKDLKENHQDGSRTFVKKAGSKIEGSGVHLIEQGGAARDTSAVVNFAAAFQEEVSSTPPSMKGQSEGNVAGVLNEQRIQQAYVQNAGFTNNFMGFLTRRARLWKAIWKEFLTYEEVIRVLEKKDDSDPDWIAINEIAMDAFGNQVVQNSLDDADLWDLTFEDSWKSPTVRDKVRQQIIQLKQNASTQQDPVLSAVLDYYFLQLSDAPQDLKKTVREHSQVLKAQEAEKQAMEAQKATLEQARVMQDIATQEAQATTQAPLPTPSRQPEGARSAPRPMEAALA